MTLQRFPTSELLAHAGQVAREIDKKLAIKRENGQYNAYKGDTLIATIHDHRKEAKNKSEVDRFSTIRDDWNVCWMSGRVDWHGTLQEARANVCKGATRALFDHRDAQAAARSVAADEDQTDERSSVPRGS